MKKRKISVKRKIEISAFIILIVLLGICIILCVDCGREHNWIWFSVYLALSVVVILVEIPIYYHGAVYTCPKCGQSFKANPYKVFFTNGIFEIFNFGDTYSKNFKVKCPNCNTKEWCKREFTN